MYFPRMQLYLLMVVVVVVVHSIHPVPPVGMQGKVLLRGPNSQLISRDLIESNVVYC